jgi:hypothetical protein
MRRLLDSTFDFALESLRLFNRSSILFRIILNLSGNSDFFSVKNSIFLNSFLVSVEGIRVASKDNQSNDNVNTYNKAFFMFLSVMEELLVSRNI